MTEKQAASPKDTLNKPAKQSSVGPDTTSSHLPDEYDRRGIKLPARTLVGGIITPI